MRPKPARRPRHPLTPAEEHAFLVAGSRLFNRRRYYDAHEAWEEVWRRASGPRRELLRGMVQLVVAYEHLKRGNRYGFRSLLRQAVRRLRPHVRRPGVRELVRRAQADIARLDAEPELTLARLGPPKVMARLRGFPARAPAGAIEVEVPPGGRTGGGTGRP